MLTRHSGRALLALAALHTLTACSDSELAGPVAAPLETIALVELAGTRPALYIQKSDGSSRTRIRFNGAADQVPGNSPLVPALTDANILALRSVKWSPDGTRLAFVATVAPDQAEVVVMKADGSDVRIVSPNYAYVVSDVDWSPDGTRVAYVMATRPLLQGLELFVSELTATPRVTQVTTNSGYRGLGGTIRFAATGNALWISQVTAEQGAPLFEKVGAVRRVDLATGAIATVSENLVGEVQAVSRSGGWAIVLRRKSIAGSVYESRLVHVPLVATGLERVIVDGGQLDFAHLTTDDGRVVLMRAGPNGTDGRTFVTLEPNGGAELSIRGSGAEPLSADVRRRR